MSTQLEVPVNGSYVGIPPGFLYGVWDALQSNQTGIVALAGGGKTGATPLNATHNSITTVASAADSVLLPPGFPGMFVFVANTTATNACAVFAAGTDTINNIATSSAFSVANLKNAVFFCTNRTAAGVAKWYAILSA